MLFAGSGLMVVSGFVFAYFENFWILLLAAIIGVVSIMGGDFGPFRAIEEYVETFYRRTMQRTDNVQIDPFAAHDAIDTSGRPGVVCHDLDVGIVARE